MTGFSGGELLATPAVSPMQPNNLLPRIRALRATPLQPLRRFPWIDRVEDALAAYPKSAPALA
jgi:hypothetical protein